MVTKGQQIETLRGKIEAGERGGSDSDRSELIRFSDRLYLLKQDYTDDRHEKLLRHCTRMAENPGGLADALVDYDAAENIVKWINRNYENEETNQDYRIALRVFGKRIAEAMRGDIETTRTGYPPSIEWVPTGTSRSYDPAPDPADMLEWEADVKPMIDAAKNPRDAALIAIAFDGGFRSGELYNLTVGDISDGPHGLRASVDGKTGQRSVDLIPSVPHVQQWLDGPQGHPERENPDAPMWVKITGPSVWGDEPAEHISDRMYRKAFEECAKRAVVDKPVTPSNFRKSNATWLARQGANSALIEDRQGRKRGSKAVARYVARFGPDSAGDQYARMHGIEVETEEPADVSPIECPRCTRQTPPGEDRCMWCGQPLDVSAIEALHEDEREVRSAILKLVREDPEMIEDIDKARSLMDMFEDDPELFTDARNFQEALSSE